MRNKLIFIACDTANINKVRNIIVQTKNSDLKITFKQTNSESDLIEFIHDAIDNADAIIINAAALTHTSVAILDALNCFQGYVVEVHISDISKREEFYQQEYCGCVYSLRDTNKWRRENNRPRIKLGIKYYNIS